MGNIRFCGKGSGLARYLAGLILVSRDSREESGHSEENPTLEELGVRAEFDESQDLDLVIFIRRTDLVKNTQKVTDTEIGRIAFPAYTKSRKEIIRYLLQRHMGFSTSESKPVALLH